MASGGIAACAVLCVASLLAVPKLAAGQSLPDPQHPTQAVPTTAFLNSLGANSAINRRGEKLEKTAECAKYLGLRWFRSGIEDATAIKDFIKLHDETGVKFSWSPGSGGSNLPKLLETARMLAQAGALLAFEGPNEPNNWGITYEGKKGGGHAGDSWVPIAEYQRDMYKAVKSDPVLKNIPVWGVSESGAEVDNAGLQFLTIPEGADTLLPTGTTFADFANVHNYFYHPSSPGLMDNRTWNAADPTPACKVDGLYGNYGRTWLKHFQGYAQEQLNTLPRVTTETGTTIGGDITEEIQGLNQLSMYLDQFKRGWSYTSMYILRDRVDEAGNQKFGFFKPDYTPRKGGIYLHNLTTVLADDKAIATPGVLTYSIANEPATVHDMLLQKSDGTFELIVWGERVKGSDQVTVNLGGQHATVRVYDPTVGEKPVQTLQNIDSVTLTLSDHPFVLEVPRQ